MTVLLFILSVLLGAALCGAIIDIFLLRDLRRRILDLEWEIKQHEAEKEQLEEALGVVERLSGKPKDVTNTIMQTVRFGSSQDLANSFRELGKAMRATFPKTTSYQWKWRGYKDDDE